MPQRKEVMTKSTTAAMNSLTSPKRRAIQPVSGRAMALLTAKAVMTQVPCSELTPRLPEMVVRATLAMVVSSTCMKVARERPTVARTRLAGRKALSLMTDYQKGAGRLMTEPPGPQRLATPAARAAGPLLWTICWISWSASANW